MKNLIIMLSTFTSFLFSDAHLYVCGVNADGAGNATFDICMDSDEAVAGVQFSFASGSSGFAISGASGGAMQDAGFVISTGSFIVLGFSFTGAILPPMQGILTTISGIYSPGFGEAVIGPYIGSADAMSGPAVNLVVTTNDYALWYGGNEFYPIYDIDPGCTDNEACNYNPAATEDDGSCEYAAENFDCSGNCLSGLTDCFGICGGLGEIDECGQCNLPDYMNLYMDDCGVCFGNNQDMDCTGVCFGSSEIDACGVCNGYNQDMDCAGVCFGVSEIDDCGVCNGNNQAMDDCGVCFGNNQDIDDCGVCFGNNQDIDDCGVCFGNNQDMDSCGVCFGDNSCLGCTDETALNYDSSASVDDGSCLYPGCTYELGLNFDDTANFDDGSCIFVLGDMNNDFILDIIDIVLSVQSILGED